MTEKGKEKEGEGMNTRGKSQMLLKSTDLLQPKLSVLTFHL